MSLGTEVAHGKRGVAVVVVLYGFLDFRDLLFSVSNALFIVSIKLAVSNAVWLLSSPVPTAVLIATATDRLSICTYCQTYVHFLKVIWLQMGWCQFM